MSFITRCPACGTTFKVGPDQLNISDGWVRCGQCHEVFDATLALQPLPPAEPIFSSSVLEGVHPEPWPESSQGAVVVPGAELLVDPVSIGFIRQAQRKAFWRRRWVRVALVFVSIGLSVLLVLQSAIWTRDRLSAAYPTLTPWLEHLCQPLGCMVQPLRHLESVVLDSSALRRRGGESGLYGFEAVIKNTSDQTLAVPALELSLTDATDVVLVRRVFLPSQWPQPVLVLPPKSEWPLRLELALDSPNVSAMTGFRALLFYP